MDAGFYFEKLYPFQDEVLALLRTVETGLYLTGGTAASRGYLDHRFSDDLDLFTNDDPDFGLWADRLIAALEARIGWEVRVSQRDQRFVRLLVAGVDMSLKIEMVNDVPAHVGEVRDHPVLGRLDSAENILANKISAALDREEPKDFADIWGFCCRLGLPLSAALEGAQSKAAGIFPADLARLLCSVTEADWRVVRWIEAPPVDIFLGELRRQGEDLLLIPREP